MLRDLSLALKNPDGNFVVEHNFDATLTQRIPTINSEVLHREQREDIKNKNKDVGYFNNHPKAKIAMFILIFVLVCALGFGIPYFLIVGLNKAPENVDMPNITGLTLQEAEAKLKDIKVTYQITSEEYNNEIEKGKIISQDPPAGYKVLEKSTISIVISKGTELVKVPKLAGSTFEEAESSLNDVNLKIEKIEETSQKIQEGIVIKQEPKENTEVKAGETVKVYVSKGTGIKKIAVPSVIGEAEENAKKSLTEARI